MTFFSKPYDCNIIEEITNEELQEFLKENEIGLQIVDNATRWCAFAIRWGYKYGLSTINATSFGYMISIFFADMGVSASTEMYIKEEQMEYDIVDWINNHMNYIEDEDEKAKTLFYHIFDIYLEGMSKYEYKTENLNIRLTPSELKKFHSVEGKNNTEKFQNLLKRI